MSALLYDWLHCGFLAQLFGQHKKLVIKNKEPLTFVTANKNVLLILLF